MVNRHAMSRPLPGVLFVMHSGRRHVASMAVVAIPFAVERSVFCRRHQDVVIHCLKLAFLSVQLVDRHLVRLGRIGHRKREPSGGRTSRPRLYWRYGQSWWVDLVPSSWKSGGSPHPSESGEGCRPGLAFLGDSLLTFLIAPIAAGGHLGGSCPSDTLAKQKKCQQLHRLDGMWLIGALLALAGR